MLANLAIGPLTVIRPNGASAESPRFVSANMYRRTRPDRAAV